MLRGCLVCVICNSNSIHSFIFKLCIMIFHTLKMCTFYFVRLFHCFFSLMMGVEPRHFSHLSVCPQHFRGDCSLLYTELMAPIGWRSVWTEHITFITACGIHQALLSLNLTHVVCPGGVPHLKQPVTLTRRCSLWTESVPCRVSLTSHWTMDV